MEDIAEVLNDENACEFIEYIHWRTEERVCILLNTPKENPRWKIVAERYGFTTSEIDNFEMAKKMYNLYSPAKRILNAYKQQFPRDNFDKIRDFIINNFEINDDFEMNEMEQILNALDLINLKDDYKQKYVLEWLNKTYNLQVTPEHTVVEGITAE